MPQVVAAAVVAGVTAGSTFTIAAGLTLGFSTSAFVTSLVLSGAAQALAPKPKLPNLGGGGSGGVSGSRTITGRSSNDTRKLIYGQVRTGGNIFFMATAENANDQDELTLAIVFAAHEIEEFTKFYFNDDELTILDSSGNGLFIVTAPAQYYEVETATVSQARIEPIVKGVGGQSNPILLSIRSDWNNSTHKVTDQAYAVFRLDNHPDSFASGLPNISALIKGRKIYDPRTTTTVWSDNPALVIRDYLLDDVYGLGATAAEIDDASFIAAANICDESVSLSGGGTEKRYTFNGVVDTGNTPRYNILLLNRERQKESTWFVK